jgi:hypothetical protein
MGNIWSKGQENCGVWRMTSRRCVDIERWAVEVKMKKQNLGENGVYKDTHEG